MARPNRHKRGKRRKQSSAKTFEATATIATIGSQGDGVFDHQGQTIHVPYVLPEEVVKVSVQGSKAELLEIISRAPDRAEPVCVHYGPGGDRCGGCQLQHMPPQVYTRWKADMVHRALSQAGLEDVEVLPILTSPARSRRRATFALEQQDDRIISGFHQRQSHTMVNLEECHILHPELFQAQTDLLRVVTPLFNTRRGLKLSAHMTMVKNGLDTDLSGDLVEEDLGLRERQEVAARLADSRICRLTIDGVVFWQKESPIVDLAGVKVPVPPRSFLQATAEGEAALQQIVTDALQRARKVADLFAGCGTFTFASAHRATVHAVESDTAAITAINQARGNNVLPVTTEVRDLFRQPLMADELKPYDVVIIDPPRAGAEAQAEQLAASKVRTVVSISCNPKTFARDAAILVAGGYRLKAVQPVDQFLFSPHIELAGVFTREK